MLPPVRASCVSPWLGSVSAHPSMPWAPAGPAPSPAVQVRRPRHLHRAERGQVRGHPLHVQQPAAACSSVSSSTSPTSATFEASRTRWNIDSPANSPPIADAVQPADQLAVAPRLDRVRPAEPVQLAVRRRDVAGDPARSRATGRRTPPPPRRRRCRPGSRSRGTTGAATGTPRSPSSGTMPRSHRREPVHRRPDAVLGHREDPAPVRRQQRPRRQVGADPDQVVAGRRRAGPGRPTARAVARPAPADASAGGRAARRLTRPAP